MDTLYIYSNETGNLVERVTGGTFADQVLYAEEHYDINDYSWGWNGPTGGFDGFQDNGEALQTCLGEGA